jgi:hypothetical protein
MEIMGGGSIMDSSLGSLGGCRLSEKSRAEQGALGDVLMAEDLIQNIAS